MEQVTLVCAGLFQTWGLWGGRGWRASAAAGGPGSGETEQAWRHLKSFSACLRL